MMNTTRSVVLAIALPCALLLGCASPEVVRANKLLGQPKPILSQIEQVEIEQTLVTDDRAHCNLHDESPSYVFSVGKAYFCAVELPAKAHSLEVESLYTEYLPNSSYPDPLVLILDSNKKVVAEYRDLPLSRGRYRYGIAFLRYYYAAEITLPANAKYAVIAANPRSSTTQVAISESGVRWPIKPVAVGKVALIAR